MNTKDLKKGLRKMAPFRDPELGEVPVQIEMTEKLREALRTLRKAMEEGVKIARAMHVFDEERFIYLKERSVKQDDRQGLFEIDPKFIGRVEIELGEMRKRHQALWDAHKKLTWEYYKLLDSDAEVHTLGLRNLSPEDHIVSRGRVNFILVEESNNASKKQTGSVREERHTTPQDDTSETS